MRKLSIITLCILLLYCSICYAGEGNQDRNDGSNFSNTFTYAIVELPGNKIFQGEITKWNDYDNSEVLRLVFKDGTVMMTSYNKAVMFFEKPNDTILSLYKTNNTGSSLIK